MKKFCKGNYTIVNPQNDDCSIARGVGMLLNDHAEKAVMYTLPKEYGTGYLKKCCVAQSTVITTYDFLFEKSITMEEVSADESLKLNFHLGESFQWGTGKKQEFIVERNESCIFPGGLMKCSGRYETGVRYKGLSIKLHPNRYEEVLACFCSANAIQDMSGAQPVCKKYKMTPSVTELVRRIAEYPFSGVMEGLYIEGKILELAAVFINEMVRENDKGMPTLRLSSEDIKSLKLVKGMLDEYFSEPMTISGLSKLVYMNECKLKAGFKEIYGKPIYRYVIERRMERAKQLLDGKKMKVKDVACMVGYTNISHFIEAFRKRFGINPGVYLQNII